MKQIYIKTDYICKKKIKNKNVGIGRYVFALL